MKVVLPSTDFTTALLSSSFAIITPHLGSDGDAVASSLALSLILKQNNINSIILTSDITSVNREKEKLSSVFDLLLAQKGYPKAKNIFPPIIECFDKNIESQLGEKPIHIFVDCSSKTRIGKAFDEIQELKKELCINIPSFAIDHHQNPDSFDYSFIDSTSPSTGNLMYRLAKETLISITSKPLAIAIFYAISSDTDSFRHLKESDAETFEIAKDLTEKGVNPSIIYSEMRSGKTLFSVEYLGKILLNIKEYKNGKILVAIDDEYYFKKYGKMFRPSNSVYDTLLSVKNVELVVFLKYKEGQNQIEGSLRVPPTSHYKAHEIAFHIANGGGHEKAAGFTYDGNMNEALKKLIEVLDNI